MNPFAKSEEYLYQIVHAYIPTDIDFACILEIFLIYLNF